MALILAVIFQILTVLVTWMDAAVGATGRPLWIFTGGTLLSTGIALTHGWW